MDVQLKCVVLGFFFFFGLLFSTLYSHMHPGSTQYCTEDSLCPTQDFHGKFLRTYLWSVLTFSLPFVSTLNSSVELLKDLEFLFC